MRYLAIVLVLIGCGTDSMPGGGGGGGGGGSATMVSGTISTATTWSGTIEVTGAVTIAAGVTVTVDAGAMIETGSAITIDGTLDIEGTSGSTVSVGPAGTTAHWPGFTVASGGTLTAHYMDEVGGAVNMADGSTVTIYDSHLSQASHDLVVVEGGTLDIEYSSIGVESGQTDTTHCDTHFDGATAITITHTNISSSAYGSMFYAGSSVDWTYDNWFDNATDVATSPGVTGTFSYGWFQKGDAPSGSGIVAQNMSSTRVTDAGPRP
ncbi:MAG TPA: hypothetical protein VMJ10_09640 [Kofleriaceae bacterium]|nr:hypothetical protein [Kofleriaceae bacterium]